MERADRAAELTMSRTSGLHVPKRADSGNTLGHLVWMLEELRSGRVTGRKAHRWLGYMQGWLVAAGYATLENVKEASRQAAAEEPSRRWRHVARDSEYEVVGEASLQTGRLIAEGTNLVVYEDSDGRLWARPSAEFMDGRFVLVEKTDAR